MHSFAVVRTYLFTPLLFVLFRRLEETVVHSIYCSIDICLDSDPMGHIKISSNRCPVLCVGETSACLFAVSPTASLATPFH